jgi:hypothetical protein
MFVRVVCVFMCGCHEMCKKEGSQAEIGSVALCWNSCVVDEGRALIRPGATITCTVGTESALAPGHRPLQALEGAANTAHCGHR